MPTRSMARGDGEVIGWTQPGERRLVREPAQGHDLVDRHLERQLDELGDDGDGARDGGAFDRVDGGATQVDRTRARPQHAGHRAEQARLAGTVGPDQGDPLAAPDLERGCIHDAPVPVGDRDVVRREDRCQGRHSS